MVPLLGALLDYDSDPETYARYDAMTSRELFRQYGAPLHCYQNGSVRTVSYDNGCMQLSAAT